MSCVVTNFDYNIGSSYEIYYSLDNQKFGRFHGVYLDPYRKEGFKHNYIKYKSFQITKVLTDPTMISYLRTVFLLPEEINESYLLDANGERCLTEEQRLRILKQQLHLVPN